MVALGAVFTPWTYGLSLAFMALVDFVLFQILPRVSVCYVCKARYRGVPPHTAHGPYELLIAQTYEARAVNWAEGKLPAGDGSAPADGLSSVREEEVAP